ncbi:MAG: hypothetical protein ACJASO_001201 [Cyclobacteriaceae bacterium]|jgi:hypothetical protein
MDTTTTDHYICYTNDDKPSMDTWVNFNKEDKAMQVKYKGMLSAIDMVLIRPNR